MNPRDMRRDLEQHTRTGPAEYHDDAASDDRPEAVIRYVFVVLIIVALMAGAIYLLP